MSKRCGKCGGMMYVEVSLEDGEEWVCRNCGYREPVSGKLEMLGWVPKGSGEFHFKRTGFHHPLVRKVKVRVASGGGSGLNDEFEFQRGLDNLDGIFGDDSGY